MRAISRTTLTPRRDRHQVVALFHDGILAFELPRDATLQDLAERLAVFDDGIAGAPVGVALRPAS
jgi:hypothetical protein